MTIETQPNLRGLRTYLQQFEHPERPGRLEPDKLGITDTLHDYVQANRRGNGDYDEFGLETLKRLGHPLPPDSIVQIKGKQNRKPKDEYLPFVQDFVRNHPEGGQWGDIGDLHNTGLRRARDVWNDMEQARIREAGKEFGDYLSPEDIEAINSAVWPTQKFASGGSVKPNTTWRPLELDGIIGYITE